MYKLFKKKKLYVTLTKIQIEQTIIIFDAVFFNQEMFGGSIKPDNYYSIFHIKYIIS